MSFSRLNPSGWADDDVITPAQINGIDLNASRAVDGYAGGDINPSADINFVGSKTLGLKNGQWPALDARTLYKPQGLILSQVSDFAGAAPASPLVGADWRMDASLVGSGLAQNYVNTAAAGTRPIAVFECPNIPDQCTITRCGIFGTAASGASNPTRLPRIYLTEMEPTTGTPTQYGITTHSGSGYRGGHWEFQSAAFSLAVMHSTGRRHWISVEGEADANAAVGLVIYQVYVIVSVTQIIA